MSNENSVESQNIIFKPRFATHTWNSDFYYFSKRVIDVVVSFIALILLSPLMLAIAILIRLDSPGPVLFTQPRVGSIRRKRNKQIFWEQSEFSFYKFRTMVDKADSSIHRAFIKALINHDDQTIQAYLNSNMKIKKLVNDNRVTRLGHILRRSSLDELPQFWNVLKGEMSLIGPRPGIAYEVEMYKPWYYRRFSAKPGMTGLWQVKSRSSADFDEMILFDIEYVENQSFWLDLQIMIMTPFVVLTHRGAA